MGWGEVRLEAEKLIKKQLSWASEDKAWVRRDWAAEYENLGNADMWGWRNKGRKGKYYIVPTFARN